jgi:hypothetical protein
MVRRLAPVIDLLRRVGRLIARDSARGAAAARGWMELDRLA